MTSSPFDAMKQVVYSKGTIDPDQIKGIEVLVAKALGFIDPDSGSRASQYWAVIDPDIYRGYLACELARHGRMPSWIKKPKAEKPDELDKLIDQYFELYPLDKRPTGNAYKVFKQLVSDNLKDFLLQIYAEEKIFKKFNVRL
jgi:hypothetical protein